MSDWIVKNKGAGPMNFNFTGQGDKFGYQNNPMWTPNPSSESIHEPCGHWHKVPLIQTQIITYASFMDYTQAVKLLKLKDGILSILNIKSPASGASETRTVIKYHGGKLFVAYGDWNASRNASDLILSTSIDEGTTWSHIVVDNTHNVWGDVDIQVISLDEIYISYNIYIAGQYALWFAKSTNGGTSWTKTQIWIGTLGGKSRMAVKGQNIYIPFIDYNINYLKFISSNDGGSSWNAVVDIDTDGYVISDYFSFYALDANNLFVAYMDNFTPSLCISKSNNGGVSWTKKTVADEMIPGWAAESIIARSEQELYVLFANRSTFEIKRAKTVNGGDSWTLTNPFVDLINYPMDSSICFGNNLLFFVYNRINSVTGNKELAVAISTDYGEIWSVVYVVHNIVLKDYSFSIVGYYGL